MTQHQVRTYVATGEVPACRRCEKLPRHFVDLRKPSAGGGHFFECCGGETRTARHPTPELANRDWHKRNDIPFRPASTATVSNISRSSR